MLTTVDNPYNPNTDYDKWLMWDRINQYFTQEYLATIANVSPDMDDVEADKIIEQAMLEIIEQDQLNIYAIVEA